MSNNLKMMIYTIVGLFLVFVGNGGEVLGSLLWSIGFGVATLGAVTLYDAVTQLKA